MRLQSAFLWTAAEIEIVRQAKTQTAAKAAHLRNRKRMMESNLTIKKYALGKVVKLL